MLTDTHTHTHTHTHTRASTLSHISTNIDTHTHSHIHTHPHTHTHTHTHIHSFNSDCMYSKYITLPPTMTATSSPPLDNPIHQLRSTNRCKLLTPH
jgi:hypothetical protein